MLRTPRTLLIVASLLLAAAAHADVTYTFVGTGGDPTVDPGLGFILTTPTFIDIDEAFFTFDAETGPSILDAAQFAETGSANVIKTASHYGIPRYNSNDRYVFAVGSFGAFGSYSTTALSPSIGTLTVTPAVPEPASLAALGFGALALVRRRRK